MDHWGGGGGGVGGANCMLPPPLKLLGGLPPPSSYAYDMKFDFNGPKDEMPHNKTNKETCAPRKDSDQPGHLPSLIRVFSVGMEP